MGAVVASLPAARGGFSVAPLGPRASFLERRTERGREHAATSRQARPRSCSRLHSSARSVGADEGADAEVRSYPMCSDARGGVLASMVVGVAAACVSTSSLSAHASVIDDLVPSEEAVSSFNKQILRLSDPRRAWLDKAEMELEYDLGKPNSANAVVPGVTPGDPELGERDVVTTPSGLMYSDVTLGGGEVVKTADLVVAHVVGALAETGDEFENTYERGTALTFTLGVRPPGMCEGLEEGISTMRAGGTRLMVVPSTLGFGERGIRAPKAFIPPNADLRYEVQLLRCVALGEDGGERLCCSDANFPCPTNPEGIVTGEASLPGGVVAGDE